MHPLGSPIVLAPMAGEISTPRLVAAATAGGALGFLPAGYRSVPELAHDLDELRALGVERFGVNVFTPGADAGEPAQLQEYAQRMLPEAQRLGVAPGRPRADDDAYSAKLELLHDRHGGVVSFTFGCPAATEVAQLHAAGAEIWVTVTTPEEALIAQAAGADALVVQGLEAGGHRGYFNERAEIPDYGLLALLALVRAACALPLVAAGGIADGAGVAAALCAGAVAAQLGTAFMLTPEAATAPAHRERLRATAPTRLTRAFTGRQARGVVNRFMLEHEQHVPHAYPAVHQITAPIRAAARAAADPEAINLWAGQAHSLAREVGAEQLVGELLAQTRAALHAVRV